MPSCIVIGCKHHTSMKSSNPLLTMHVFPREFSRIKLWLQRIGQDFGDIDDFAVKILNAAKSGKYRICSAHFDPSCYTTVGCRLVLKHDAVPTVFPGVYPKPAPDWRNFSPQTRKAQTGPDVTATFYDNARKDAATQTNTDPDKNRPTALNTSLMERCNQQEEIFDASGRLVGVFSPDSQQRDLKVRPGLWTYDWSTQIPKEPSKTHPPMQNKEALSSLEKVLFSLIKHMAEAKAPQSRPQKQRTTRLLNRTAEIISILTGEEWMVVKKNAHISKFYQMIREVPIKCGDVAVFFTMDEWDYIEEHEDLYKPVMLENPKDTTSHTGNSQEKFLISQKQLSTNTDRGAGFPSVLRNVPSEQFSTLKRPEQRDSSPPDPIRYSGRKSPPHTAEHKEALREKEEVDTSGERNSKGDARQSHHTAKDEEFIKKEENAGTEKSSTDDITTVPHCDPSPKRKSSPAKVGHRWSLKNNPHQSESSVLWISADGTTSSHFKPQEDPRLPGGTHRTYSRKPLYPQSPISLFSDMNPDGEPNYSRTNQTGSKRARTGSKHWCNQCNEHFPDTYQLRAHQKLHTKKPRW